MFSSILTGTTSYLSISQVLACTAASIVCGMIIALAYKYTEHPSRNFLISVVILPAVVQMIILMVNGNLGVGVAVAGSFSLVRFRSLPGKASDIVIIFLAMGAGLMTGMGYIWLAVCCAVLISLLFVMTARIKRYRRNSIILWRHIFRYLTKIRVSGHSGSRSRRILITRRYSMT
ncbi:MAG: DUF4956 domain-containing protein [Erysipelotrichaceae bacterium]|nr:DUF4956 domain-containing protein [Erysipelotrichaceae bacterium]